MRVDGRAVDVWRRGEGPTLLYLHGLADVHALSPARPWPFLEALARGFDVVAPAHPGYGASTPLGPDAAIEDWTFHYADVVDALGGPPVAVVGHSIGGWLAAELTVRHPALVRRLVLVAPLGLHVRGVTPEPFFGAATPRGLGGFADVRRVLFADGEGDAARAALPDDLPRDQQVAWFAGLAGAARLGWKAPQLADAKLGRRLSRVKAPTLLLAGDADRLVPATHVAAWATALPGVVVETVAGAGHALPIERPAAVAERVIRFVDAA